MEALVAHAPLFFADGVRAANELAQAEPRALAALLARAGQGGGSVGSGSALPAGAGAALEYLVVGLRRLKVSDAAEVSAALVRLTPASAALAGALAAAAVGSGSGSSGSGGSGTSAGVPRLLGVDWAVTVPVASSSGSGGAGSGAGAGAPGVTLQLRVEQPGGATATRAVHLSVAQLALVEASFREAALSLERA